MSGFGYLEIDRRLQGLLSDLESLENLQDEMTALVGKGSAMSGLVTAEVDYTGRVTDVALHQRARRVATTALTAAITEACRAASDNLEQQTQDLLATQVSTSLNPQEVLASANHSGHQEMVDLVTNVSRAEDPAGEATRQLKRLQHELGVVPGRTKARR